MRLITPSLGWQQHCARPMPKVCQHGRVKPLVQHHEEAGPTTVVGVV